MVDIAQRFRRLRRYVAGVDLTSAGAVVAASAGEPALAYQLERIRFQATDATLDPHLHRRVGRLEST
jgi:hypothetical protein